MKLSKVAQISISPARPFNFDKTFFKPDHFTSGDNFWISGTRWQTFFWKDRNYGVVIRNLGRKDNPSIGVAVYCNRAPVKDEIDELVNEIKYRYNLDLNLDNFYSKFRNDPILKPVIRRMYGTRPGHPSSLYEYLIIGIVLQNATVGRSIQMFRLLLEKYGVLVEFAGRKLWCFWKPGGLERVSEEELRLLKVGYRARSIKKIDEQFLVGNIDEDNLRKKDMEIQRTQLLKLYGVGPATVWYLLFDVFHHWDYFDHVSPWEQKIYSKIFFGTDTANPVSVARLLKHINKYGEYKHLAIHYIWEDLWWKHKKENIPWLEKIIAVSRKPEHEIVG